MQQSTSMSAVGGRAASRERRAQLVQGKAALPSVKQRSRTGEHSVNTAPVAVTLAAVTPIARVAPAVVNETVISPVANMSRAASGRAASMARRQVLVQGKGALLKQKSATRATEVVPPADSSRVTGSPVTSTAAPMMNPGRAVAQAMRMDRARNGRGNAAPARPSARLRDPELVRYPSKVAQSQSYSGQEVTGVRIGRGTNVTGDESGAEVQVTGSQYIGKESGFNPREGGVKVGAARTDGGQVVTGTQVRSLVKITGDESNSAIRITGEADQELADDLLNRREQGAYTSMQFQRQNNPHGHSVFGANLGRSIKSIGSRERAKERAIEQTDGGQPISGTALGRSIRVTGDEAGSCRPITGDQYLLPANKQALCEGNVVNISRNRAGTSMAMNSRLDPVTGEKVVLSESWTRQRITGVDVEHNQNVTGDEYGVCSSITGTQYVGPGQYESFCDREKAHDTAQRVAPGAGPGNSVTGDTPRHVDHVTGTARGADRGITGTPYYRADVAHEVKTNVVERVNSAFSVRSPQRDGQLKADPSISDAPTAEGRITGSFAVGDGKITGNKEFHFHPRGRVDRDEARSRITGEGSMAGTAITGNAWSPHAKLTGTEGYIAAERNPSERAGKPKGFANATVFKSKAKNEEPKRIVTGMVGWSGKTAAKVTLSGGAHG